MPDNFIQAVQSRAARISASVSATRNQGPEVSEKARDCLCQLDLHCFGISHQRRFEERLDLATEALMAVLPTQPHESWGLARKVLNIFLRDAFYTTYLHDHFHLERAEYCFEIPLDSITSGYLRQSAGPRTLPAWPGVSHLTADQSDEYQFYAACVAAEQGFARVHLDTYWWGQREDFDWDID